MSQPYLDEIEVDGESYLVRDRNTKSDLTKEISRSTAAEDELRADLETLSDDTFRGDAVLANRISEEESRATSAENGLRADIQTEVTRAKAIEDELRKDVGNLEDDVTLINDALERKYEQKINAVTAANGVLALRPIKYGVKTVVTNEINTLDTMILQDPTGLDWAEYSLSFKVSMSVNAFNFPSNFLWADGVKPKIEADTNYELHVVATRINSSYIYKANLSSYR